MYGINEASISVSSLKIVSSTIHVSIVYILLSDEKPNKSKLVLSKRLTFWLFHTASLKNFAGPIRVEVTVP